MQTNQHWVPKLLIKNFVDTDGRVYCLDVLNDQLKKRPPKYVASSPGFNEFRIGEKLVSFEDKLEKIETLAAPVLKQIIDARAVTGLDKRQRTKVANFIAAQSFRTEAFYKGTNSTIAREEFGAVFAHLWRSAFLVSEEVQRRRWAVMAIESDDIFLLGDHPVVLQHTEEPSSRTPLGFDIVGVEAYLPLAPKVALYLPCLSISEQIISGFDSAIWLHRQVRMATSLGDRSRGGDAMLQLAQRVMRESGGLHRALTEGVSVCACPENVQHLNYLQCAFAHAAVYSNKSDFAFARKVFGEQPQYRQTVRTGFAAIGSKA